MHSSVAAVAQPLHDILGRGDPVFGVEMHLSHDFRRHHVKLLVLLLLILILITEDFIFLICWVVQVGVRVDQRASLITREYFWVVSWHLVAAGASGHEETDVCPRVIEVL